MTGAPSRRVWIVGPVAWDTVAYLPALPAAGAYTQSRRTIERPGGTAGNVAQALATTGVETGFVTGLGDDVYADRLRLALTASGVRHLVVTRLAGGTHRVMIFVDDEGERTMVGLSPNGLDAVDLTAADLEPDDVVVFVVWDDVLLDELAFATARGCTTVVGLAAVMNPAVSADLAFGSRSDLPRGPQGFDDLDLTQYLGRFGRIVMTRGEAGAVQLERGRVLHQPALPAEVVDTTGAGDAFLAGYLSQYAAGLTDGPEALAAGARWAAAAVSVEASVPPPWADVPLPPPTSVARTG
jgi:sugar/nucleoside kinase (ribokinase family)